MKRIRFKISKTSNSDVNAIAGYNEEKLVVFDKYKSDSIHDMRKAKDRIIDKFEMITSQEHIEDKDNEPKEVH